MVRLEPVCGGNLLGFHALEGDSGAVRVRPTLLVTVVAWFLSWGWIEIQRKTHHEEMYTLALPIHSLPAFNSPSKAPPNLKSLRRSDWPRREKTPGLGPNRRFYELLP